MSNINTGMFRPIQDGAIEALENVPDSFHDERNAVYGRRKEIVFEIVNLLRLKANRNTSGMFVWAKVPEKLKDVDELRKSILGISKMSMLIDVIKTKAKIK